MAAAVLFVTALGLAAPALAQGSARIGRPCEDADRARARAALEVGRGHYVECHHLSRSLRVDAAIAERAPEEENGPIRLHWATSRTSATSRGDRVLARGELDLRTLFPRPDLIRVVDTFELRFREVRAQELQLSILARFGEDYYQGQELIWVVRLDRRSGRWRSLWLGEGDSALSRMGECEIYQEVRLRIRGRRAYRRWHMRRYFNPDRSRTDPPVAERDRECRQAERPPTADNLVPRDLAVDEPADEPEEAAEEETEGR